MLRPAQPRQGSGQFARGPNHITERDAYELGFRDGFNSSPGPLRLRLKDRHGELYDRGYALGRQMPCTPGQASAAAPEARRRADAMPTPAGERQSPCRSCEWIGLCAITGFTCPVFRGWVSIGSARMRETRERQARQAGRSYSPRVIARVPDKPWERSFSDE